VNTLDRAVLPRSLNFSGIRGSAGASPYRRLVLATLSCLSLFLAILDTARAAEPGIRFQAIHVHLDVKSDSLAAYQISVRATKGKVGIVGIEGGEPAAFRQPPFYDPKAIQQERVILAAFSTKPKADLPTGRVRIATIHLQIAGEEEPEFEANVQAAANVEGAKISPTVSIEPVKP